MDTALYIRVSTMHQKPDLQADGLQRYAKRAGLEIAGLFANFEAALKQLKIKAKMSVQPLF